MARTFGNSTFIGKISKAAADPVPDDCLQAHTLRLKRVYQRKSEEVRNLTIVPEATSPPVAGPSNGGGNREIGHGHSHNHSHGSGHSGSSPGSRSGGHGTPLTPHISTSSSHDVLVSGASEYSLTSTTFARV